jgi:peptidyl-prolyl cis-trans isomerase SurA
MFLTLLRARSIWPVLALSALLLPAAGAHAEVIERVAAVVNDRAILLSDLRRRAAPFLEQALSDAAGEQERVARVKQIYKQLLQQLVDEELVEQAARKMHVSISEIEIDQAIDNVRRQNSMTEEAFWQAVRAQGYNEKQYRLDVRKQLLRLKVLNQRVRSRVNITELTVREAYDDRVRDARRTQKFHAAHAFMPLHETAGATEVAQAMAQARQLRARLTPENFDTHAAQTRGGDLGWLDQGDLPEVLEDALLRLSEGEISEPVRGPSGIHIFIVRARQSGAKSVPAYEDVRVQLHNELLDRAMARQEQLFIKGLRRDAVIDARE